MAILSGITLPDGSYYDFRDKNKTGIYTVVGTQASATAAWTGSINVSSLQDGMVIAYRLPQNSAANVTLNLTLNDSTTTGAVPVYFTGSTRMGTQYSAGTTVYLTYVSASNRWTSMGYDESALAARVTFLEEEWAQLMNGDVATYGGT